MTNSVKRTVKKNEVTADQVKQSFLREYNPREWESKINWYAIFYECKFYFDEEINKYFVIYKLKEDSPRFYQEFGYTSSLVNCGFQYGFVGEDKIIFFKYHNMLSIENTNENRKVLSENCKNNQNIFYWN
jgi:hypothetical protein